MKQKPTLKRKLLLVLLLAIPMFFAQIERAIASHIMGGQITYTYVSGNTYNIRHTFYRDCSGIDAPVSIFAVINPGNISLTLLNTAVNDVSLLCPGQTSICNPGGTSPGIQEVIYEANVTLNTPNVYTISIQNNSRNTVITTLVNPGGQAVYLTTTLNTLISAGNSSPQFLNKPIGQFCSGSPSTVNPNAFDPNGDIIKYSLVDAVQSPGFPAVYQPGFSGLNPLSSSTGVAIDVNTGEVSFTSSAIEVAVIAIRAEEFRVIAGVQTKIGEVFRDIQIKTVDCTGNSAPTMTTVSNGIVHVGNTFCTTVTASDDVLQTLTLNATAAIIPPATFNIINSGAGFMTGEFCFTPTAGDIGNTYTITFNAKDDYCPTPGAAVRSFNLTVPAPCNVNIQASVIQSTCGASNGSITANLLGGTSAFVYTWTGPGFSSSAQPTVSGLAPGTYHLSIRDAFQCAADTDITIINQNTSSTANIFICDGDSYTPPGGLPMTSSGTQVSHIANAVGCDSSITTVLTVYPPFSASAFVPVPIGCYNGTGCVDICANGGLPPYEYNTVFFASCTQVCGIAAGVALTWTVIDANGCLAVTSPIGIGQPPKLEVICSATPTFGSSLTGGVCVTGSGGTGGYQFAWVNSSNTPIGNTDCVSGLGAGIYTVIVEDANRCTATCNSEVIDICTGQPPPGTISGPGIVCAKQCFTYSVPTDPTITSYDWMLPAGVTGSSNGSSITVCISTKVKRNTPIYICVRAHGPCGISQYTCKTVMLADGKPNKPGEITGENLICANVASVQTYCVPADANVTSYNWIITGNSIPSLSFASPQGSNCIDVLVPAGYNGNQKLKVTPVNCKGNGSSRELEIKKVTSAPGQPGLINGPGSVCKSNFNKKYSVPAMSTASSFTWTIIQGDATISAGQGTREIFIDFRTTTSAPVIIMVTATNGCGTSIPRYVNINVNLLCRNEFNSNGNVSNEFNLTAYPNPTSGKVNVEFNGIENEKYTIKLVDVIGQVLIHQEITGVNGLNSNIIDLSAISKGMYFIYFSDGNSNVKTTSLVVE